MGFIDRFRKKKLNENFEESYQRNTPLGRKQYFKQRDEQRKTQSEISKFDKYKAMERQEKYNKSTIGRVTRFQNRVVSKILPRQTPSSQQRFYKTRAKVMRGVRAFAPGVNQGGIRQGSQGRVKYGRGRPTGSYKYFIPGKDRVSVFEYRNYITSQKQLMKMQLEQQRAMMKVAQRFQNKYNPEMAMQQAQMQMQNQQMQQPQMQMPVQRPQFAGQSVPQVQPQPYKEISVLERTPINMQGNSFSPMNETYEETDLMTGRTSIRRRDGGFL